jgi:hypothetical protein
MLATAAVVVSDDTTSGAVSLTLKLPLPLPLPPSPLTPKRPPGLVSRCISGSSLLSDEPSPPPCAARAAL